MFEKHVDVSYTLKIFLETSRTQNVPVSQSNHDEIPTVQCSSSHTETNYSMNEDISTVQCSSSDANQA